MTTAVLGSRLRLAGGVHVHFVEQPGEGTPVLLLHGYSDSWFSFSPVFPLLPRGVRAIALDQRGHGESDAPPGLWSIGDLARDAVELLDELGIERAIVAGHSMSGLVALHLAALAPDRVHAALIVSSSISARQPAILELALDVARLTDPVDEAFVRAFQRSTICRPVPVEFLETVVSESLRLSARSWQTLMHAMLSADYGDRAAEIRVPVRVLWGDQDVVFPWESQTDLLRAIPRAEFTVVPGVGHALHWEAPAALADAIGALALADR